MPNSRGGASARQDKRARGGDRLDLAPLKPRTDRDVGHIFGGALGRRLHAGGVLAPKIGWWSL
jgi:hypothetical protein